MILTLRGQGSGLTRACLGWVFLAAGDSHRPGYTGASSGMHRPSSACASLTLVEHPHPTFTAGELGRAEGGLGQSQDLSGAPALCYQSALLPVACAVSRATELGPHSDLGPELLVDPIQGAVSRCHLAPGWGLGRAQLAL